MQKKKKNNLLFLCGKRGEINWELGTDRYPPLYIKQIPNKDLLYSPGKYSIPCHGLFGERV